MDLQKRRQYKLFATWLNDNNYLNERYSLIPYELAEMYLESDYYKELLNESGGNSDQSSEEEIREPIQNALYATGTFTTDQCSNITDGILLYLKEAGFKVVKQ